MPIRLMLSVALLWATSATATPIRCMSFNTWHAGTQVVGGTQAVVDAVAAANADVVGFQESEGRIAREVAAALGWYALQGPASVAIASRFPITEVFAMARDASALGVRLRIAESPARDVIVWSVHLGYTSYGPYAACDGAPIATLQRGERVSGRVRQMRDIVRRTKRQVKDAAAVPVVLMGDFNAPSHLDWTTAAAGSHCGVTMAWPVTVQLARQGFVDAFRSVHPDPVTTPGTTWSTVFPAPDEPQDRIDFVHLAGAATALEAEVFVVGTPSPSPGHGNNAWPSDHAAVLVTADVTPTSGVTDRAPTLVLDRASYASADPIVATVAGGPGNGTDWVGIYRPGEDPLLVSSTTWLYLSGSQRARSRGPTAATVRFPAGTLPPGSWVARFLYADGSGEMAPAVPFTVAD
ncbi:MAG TPA: endonuclease/exonuclease/phosphatase family protein [Candidatus Binatia bacterium]|jgi:endonuclease/exonuclease/phosphatase family metal-dependent hydrolase|nr:endonuclease/exonuclease/phosphatase family protein [Candidatus Binatia bacterium]